MTRDDFLAKHRNVFYGLVSDALTSQRHGELAGAWLRQAFQTVNQELIAIWTELQPKDPPAAGLEPTGKKP